MLNYSLPKERIALQPAEPRDSARLLVVHRKPGTVPATGLTAGRPSGDSPRFFSHRIFHDLPDLLKAGDCLVLNDTKVIPARLRGRRAGTGGKVELLLLSETPESSEKARIYRCLGQPAKNLKPGTRLQFNEGSLQAEVIGWEEGERLVRFEGRGAAQTLLEAGEVPLPPYIDRPVETRDADWYQTVYARQTGAVAAPTAGLHFTPELLERIRAKGVRVCFLTLHVGWGTFKPVGERELESGKLHPERFEIPAETIAAIQETKDQGGRVIAVGTTVVRTLEAGGAGWVNRLRADRAATVSRNGSLAATSEVEREADRHGGAAEPSCEPASSPRPTVLSGETDLFIRPGFEFRVVDAMITNFHLPGTSLLLLVSAFAGEERIQHAYQEAMNQKYRFYSYGDAMLIL